MSRTLWPTELMAHITFLKWSGWQDLNPRPTGPKPVALPNCATPRYYILFSYLAGAVGFEPTARGFGDHCSTNWAIPLYVAEKMGFEPMRPLTNPNGLANRPLQPTWVLLQAKLDVCNLWRRGWDSNPRPLSESLVFKTSSLNHSDTSPHMSSTYVYIYL